MFVVGKDYSRRRDIHDRYGGQRQSGISASSSSPFIFIFSGSSGEAYGYEDGWHEDEKVFLYSGEGQVGDMQFTRGNRAIRDHAQDGKQLLLFRALGHGKPVRYVGEFMCAGYHYDQGPDRKGDTRKTIRFHLVPVEDNEPVQAVTLPKMPIQELREKAFGAAMPEEGLNWRQANVRQRVRRQTVKEYVLMRANGVCELTGQPAPFNGKDGKPYLEVHHIQRLSDGGLDHPVNCAAITPNAHREIHHGLRGKELDAELAEKIAKLEQM